MTNLDLYFELKAHNTNLLNGWAKGTYTRKECIQSLKFIQHLDDPTKTKVFQLREEGYTKLMQMSTLMRIWPPYGVVAELLKMTPSLTCPADREFLKDFLQ